MDDGTSVESFAFSIYRASSHDDIPAEYEDTQRPWPYSFFLPQAAFCPRDVIRIGSPLLTARATLSARSGQLRKWFNSQIVIIGGVWHKSPHRGSDFVDGRSTPSGRMPGVLVHANYVQSLLWEAMFPISEDLRVAIEVFLAVGISFIFLVARGWSRARLVLGTLIALVCLTWVFSAALGIFFDLVLPVLFLGIHTLTEELFETFAITLRVPIPYASRVGTSALTLIAVGLGATVVVQEADRKQHRLATEDRLQVVHAIPYSPAQGVSPVLKHLVPTTAVLEASDQRLPRKNGLRERPQQQEHVAHDPILKMPTHGLVYDAQVARYADATRSKLFDVQGGLDPSVSIEDPSRPFTTAHWGIRSLSREALLRRALSRRANDVAPFRSWWGASWDDNDRAMDPPYSSVLQIARAASVTGDSVMSDATGDDLSFANDFAVGRRSPYTVSAIGFSRRADWGKFAADDVRTSLPVGSVVSDERHRFKPFIHVRVIDEGSPLTVLLGTLSGEGQFVVEGSRDIVTVRVPARRFELYSTLVPSSAAALKPMMDAALDDPGLRVEVSIAPTSVPLEVQRAFGIPRMREIVRMFSYAGVSLDRITVADNDSLPVAVDPDVQSVPIYVTLRR